jgi:hypothetical protein
MCASVLNSMNTLFTKLRNRRCSGGLLLLFALLLTGCSGINASKSISPLDFLLPGLHIRNDPPAPAMPDDPKALVCWHQLGDSGSYPGGESTQLS